MGISYQKKRQTPKGEAGGSIPFWRAKRPLKTLVFSGLLFFVLSGLDRFAMVILYAETEVIFLQRKVKFEYRDVSLPTSAYKLHCFSRIQIIYTSLLCSR